jgi:hypothetical protein
MFKIEELGVGGKCESFILPRKKSGWSRVKA